jgi:hypothetical protein
MNSGMDSYITALGTYKGSLYAGGDFTMAGGVSANGIARFGFMTGIEEKSRDAKVQLFPNPSQGRFSIVYDAADSKTELAVYDVCGKEVYREMLKQGIGTHLKSDVDLGTLSKGLYIYTLTNAGKKISGKISIVQ